MDDTHYGTSDRRGDWKPFKVIQYPPVFVWPAQPMKLLKWLFGYPGFILPWNLLYAMVGLVLWLYLTPPIETMKECSAGWLSYLLARNAVIAFLFFGSFHLRLYILKRQGNSFKFNAKWPSTDNSAFLFGKQTLDNMFWTFASAVPFWTAYEAVMLWAFANEYIPFVSFEQHPYYSVAVMLLIPLWRDLHFYCIHRLIHWPPLYRSVHKLHHNNVNPGPWSGLAMHPVEHLLYFSCVLIHCIVPSHPVHVLFNLAHTALAPAPGHVGFDKILVGGEMAVASNCYDHYLHHKYFECNYADGVVPLDKWFGTFHDGSPEAEAAMNRRFIQRAQRQAAKRARSAAKAK
jgi:sterol desaturase/sphingolipid hydroxylase (fatty acid hydroxylase superfamily)